MHLRQFCRCVILLVLTSTAALPQSTTKKNPARSTPSTATEKATAAYLESIRNQPSLLMDFLRRMPKGADLHNHLSGAIYAENLIKWAVQDGLCVNVASSTFVACDASGSLPKAATAYSDVNLYEQL